jgi:death-on-curing protein
MEEHGGAVGAVNDALLDSACARPRNHWAYTDPRPDLAALAATLGYGLARNHCFIDGNKRIALAAVDMFLGMNGFYLDVSEAEAVVIFREIAAGAVDESATNQWVRNHKAKADKPVISK